MAKKAKTKAEPWPNFGQWFFFLAMTAWVLAAFIMTAVTYP